MIIPLSLYVTIECTKLLQVYLMHEDLQLYDELYDKRVECKALNIPEELGQVISTFQYKSLSFMVIVRGKQLVYNLNTIHFSGSVHVL